MRDHESLNACRGFRRQRPVTPGRMTGRFPVPNFAAFVAARTVNRFPLEYAHAVADTSYASCGDLSLAYQVFGNGPVALIVAPPFVSHLELAWTLPQFKAYFEQLATFCRVALFDKAGVGLSDPVPKVRTLEERTAEVEAVMDAVGFKQAVVCGLSDGGPVAMMFAATRPERVRALILCGTIAYWGGFAGWDDMDRDPAELRARFLAELGKDYTPSIEQLARFQKAGRAVRSGWGSGVAASISAPSFRSMRQLAMYERMSASPGMVRASFEAAFRIDVRPILPTLTVPTLVIHAREDNAVPVQGGRYLADHIPGARYLEVEGVDHAPFITEPGKILAGVEEFLTGRHGAPAQSHRALRTVLFTDIVASTQHAAATAPSPRSTARRRPFAAPRRCAMTPRHWASRSAPASTPANANCSMRTSGGSRYTSRPASLATPVPATSWSHARCGT